MPTLSVQSGAVGWAGGVLWNRPDGEQSEGWFPLYPMFAAPPKVPKYQTKNVSGQLLIKWENSTKHSSSYGRSRSQAVVPSIASSSHRGGGADYAAHDDAIE
eukprot:742657-Prorocentrum_minimum.AAC.1